jgi:hypothetical protein
MRHEDVQNRRRFLAGLRRAAKIPYLRAFRAPGHEMWSDFPALPFIPLEKTEIPDSLDMFRGQRELRNVP